MRLVPPVESPAKVGLREMRPRLGHWLAANAVCRIEGCCMSMSNGAIKALTGPPRTGRYRSSSIGFMGAQVFGGWGAWHLGYVDQMRKHPQIKLCLGYRKAPLFSAKFMVNAANPQEKAYVEATYQRFMRKSLRVALRSYEYGYAPAETLFKVKNGAILFDRLKPIHPRDAVPWTVNGQLHHVEITMNNGPAVQLAGSQSELPGKAFWIAHDSDWNPWFGHSIFETIFVPWRMSTMPQGAQETLFKWAYKYSIAPLEIGYPLGMTETEEGEENNADIARQMGEWIKAGGVVTKPTEKYPTELGGGDKWALTWAKIEGHPAPLLDYADKLDQWMQRGLEIPDEIITHEGSTGGYSRSRVAVGAFYDGAEESLNHVMEAFDEQICRPAVRLNFGQDTYTIEPMPLLPPDQQGQQAGMPGQQPGMPPPGQPGQAPPGQPPGQPGAPGGQGAAAGGKPSQWIDRVGKRGGQQHYNPQTGAVKYGQMSLTEGEEAELYRLAYDSARKKLARAKRNGEVQMSRETPAPASQPITVNVPAAPQPHVTVNVESPQVRPTINVTVPDIHVPEAKVTVNVPPAEKPEVHVEVNVPKQAPPTVNVNVPKQAPPTVQVTPQINVNVPKQPAPTVNVNVPETKQPDKAIKIVRDETGKIVGGKIETKPAKE
jgi:hypothetical protein